MACVRSRSAPCACRWWVSARMLFDWTYRQAIRPSEMAFWGSTLPSRSLRCRSKCSLSGSAPHFTESQESAMTLLAEALCQGCAM